jgi:signal transduction histidine kinase
MKLSYYVLLVLLIGGKTCAQNIDSLLVVAQNIKNDSVSLTKMNAAGYACLFKDADKAYNILHKTRLKAARVKRPYNHTEVLNTLGVYHDLSGNRDSAQFYFNKALNISKKNKFKSLEVRSINNLGMLNWNRGKFNKALDYFLEAEKLNEKLPDEASRTPKSTMYSNIGLIYQEMNLFDKALLYHKKAYDYRLNKKRTAELAVSLNNMAICNERLGNREKAITFYREGLEIARNNNKHEYYKLLENYTSILIDLQQYNEAEAMLLECLNMPKEVVCAPKTKFLVYTRLTNVNINMKRPDVALKYGKAGLEVLEKEPDLEVAAGDIYIDIARAYYMKGDMDNGHKYSGMFAKNARYRFSTENATGLADMEVKYETEKKEKLIAEGTLKLLRAEAEARRKEMLIAENEAMLLKGEAEAQKKEKIIAVNISKLLKSEAESGRKGKLIAENKALLFETEAAARNKSYMLIISLCVIGFLSVIGYLLYRQQRLRNRQLEKEFELKSALAQIENQNRLQEQRLDISRDLHDNIGAQLTFIISTLDSLKYRLHETVPSAGSKLEGISNFTRQTILELRDTIWAMNTKHITFEDLRARILNFMEKAREAKENIDFSFGIDPALIDVELSSVTGMNIYRTIQEAINNTIKHSGATKMDVTVFIDNGLAGILIADNGRGFNEHTITHGNGLYNMQKRIEDIGGSFTVFSSNLGTQIKIHLQRQVQSA